MVYIIKLQLSGIEYCYGDIKGINYVLKLNRIFFRLPILMFQVPASLPQLSLKSLFPTFDLATHKRLKAIRSPRQDSPVCQQLSPLLQRLPMSFATCVENVILQDVSFNHIQMRTTNPNIAWKDTLSGKAITKIKGPNASLDIRQRPDKSQDVSHPSGEITLFHSHSTYQ